MTHWTEETYVENPEVIGANMRQGVEPARNDVADLLELLGEHGVEPTDALDVACGIGRHAIPLAEAGLEVRGVDLATKYVERARERAAAAGVADRTTFDVEDMRDLGSVEGRSDLVLCWLSFGHFDDETNVSILEAFRDRVASNGALVLGLHNRDGAIADFQASGAAHRNGLLKVNRTEYAPETARMKSRIAMFREGDGGYESIGEAVVDFRLYGPAELRRLLERVGFSAVDCYAAPDGGDLTLESDRLVVVAQP